MAELYKVGGYVRDKLLGIKSNDIDFTYVSSNLNQTVEEGYAEMRAYLETNGFTIFLETPEFVTIRSMFPEGSENKGIVADFVLARKEIGYASDSRKPEFTMGTLKDDLKRRDFTVNALAEDKDGVIIDYFDGRTHIRNKILTTPLESIKTMMDDPLRFIRALRFCVTKQFSISYSILGVQYKEEFLVKLDQVVHPQRIRMELEKMFKYDSIRTIDLLSRINNDNPRLMHILFRDDLWLFPTFKTK